MPKITGETQWLVEALAKDYSRLAPPDVPTIKLSQLVSKLGFFYEKLRNAIDYSDEHLIRHNSLRRFLKRQVIFLQEKDPKKISQALINEFIRAKYLPNDALPETLIDEVGRIIAKYLIILKQVGKNPPLEPAKIIAWTLDLAMCEIDENLFPIDKELAIANYMYAQMTAQLNFKNAALDGKEKNLQIYLTVLRTLLKADRPLLKYRLFKLYHPNWPGISLPDILEFYPKMDELNNKIEAHLNFYLGFQITQNIRPQSVFFKILRQLIETNQQEIAKILTNEKLLEEKITAICSANYQRIRGKLMGSIFRVIIYILFTKTILAFILELPFDKIFIGTVNWQALVINVVFHPLLMFIIAMSIRIPGRKNTQLIISEIKKIISGEERKLIFKARKIMKRGSFSNLAFNGFYLTLFAISFGLVILGLNKLHFNLVSGVLFIFFLSVVSFFGFRLRNFANQYLVLPRKENLFNLLMDILTLPIIRVGQFFSSNFSRINIFLYILDFIIETPFKLLLEIIEKAVSFIREKREEIVE